ncbi:MAG: Fe-S cluster assembly protein SufD [Cyanobacteria bacterium P01_F01_bin.150]
MTVQTTSDVEGRGASPKVAITDLNVFLNQRSPLSSEHPAYDKLTALRGTSAERLSEFSFPTTRDEEWRFTKMSPLLALNWDGTLTDAPSVTQADVDAYCLPEAETRLVFVNGVYRAELSSIVASDGVTIGALSDAETGASLSVKIDSYLGCQQGLEQAFTILNTASFEDAAVIWLDKKAIAPHPIHILSITTAADSAPRLSHPRVLMVAEPHSEVTLVEDFITLGKAAYFTNPVTEIYVKENAHVNHIRVQRDGKSAFHIGKTAVSQGQNSYYACHAISVGGRISRHNVEIFQGGVQTETILNGLSMITGRQLADTHSLIAYEYPNSSSRQLHKTIVGGSAHAVFNGKVYVPQAAQLTDAGQLNRNLLLSPKGRVDTKPQLEIVADDVRCTHGATVSQLKADEVFYLQSRGIDAARAQNLLVYAFAAEILEELPVESLKEQLIKSVEGFIQAN